MKYFLVVIAFLICAGCGSTNLTEATKTLPAATVGTTYSQTLAAVGGTTPYVWSITSGALPIGLTLSTSGVISGTPSTAGTSTFTVNVSDSSNPVSTSTQNLTIQVTSTTLTTLAPGQSITLLTSGESIIVPSGTTIQSTNGSFITVNGDNNTINTSVGAIVSAPTSATGPADNTVIAQ
jgi:hypothetical protein